MKALYISFLIFVMPINMFAQWEWQNPKTTGNSLNWLDFLNSNIAWSVGDAGAILKTTDGGNSWINQTSNTYNNLNSVSFIDTLNGWIVGEEGTILKTTDAGNEWHFVVNNFSDYNFTSEYFVNQNIGWIVGGKIFDEYNSESIILKTTDGGNIWIEQGEKTIYLLSCFFINENIGWVTGGRIHEGNIIYRTTDGGISWEFQDSNVSGDLRSINFLNENFGFIVGGNGLILKTVNGGNTWIQILSGTVKHLYQVKFLNNGLGWIVGGSCLRTTNAGNTWQEIEFPESLSISYKSFDFIDENILFSVAKRGRIIKSTDSGLTWQHTSGFFYNPYSVHFFDSLNGIASADQGKFLKTSDGGEYWIIKHTNTNYSFTELFMLDQNTGWAIASTGAPGDYIFKTIDGGDSWFQKAYYPDIYLRDIYFLDYQHGWACGRNGTIVHSTDGGNTWFQQYSNSLTGEIRAIHFTSANMGFAASQDAYVGEIFYTTTNGGVNWDSTHIFIENVHIYGPQKIQFHNEQDGWLLLRNCLLKTNDGGLNWNILIKHYDFTDFNDMFFVGENIWITGNRGLILNSTNNGQSWGVQSIDNFPQFPSNNFKSISMVGENIGWVVGYPNAVLKTVNGGQNFIPNPSIPLLTYPENNSVVFEAPWFSWQRVYGMLYRLQISTDQSFNYIESDGIFMLNYAHPYMNYKDSTRYYWRSRTENQIGVSDWSDVWSFSAGHIVGVENDNNSQPTFFSLSQNYPNPFNPTTSLQYTVGSLQFVTIKVYDLLGREIATLINEEKPVGEYEVEFDGTGLPSGIYFYRIKAGSFINTKKMVLLR